jgi:hypothetical protein
VYSFVLQVRDCERSKISLHIASRMLGIDPSDVEK